MTMTPVRHRSELETLNDKKSSTSPVKHGALLGIIVLMGLGALLFIRSTGSGGASVGEIRMAAIGLTAVCIAAALIANLAVTAAERPTMLGFSYPALFGLYLGVSSLAWTSQGFVPSSVRSQISQTSVLHALQLAAGGILAWLVGWSWPKRGAGRSTMKRGMLTDMLDRLSGALPSRAVLWKVYMVGIIARLAVIGAGSFAYITSDLNRAVSNPNPILGLLARLDGLTILAILLMLARTIEIPEDRSARVTVAVMVASEVGFALLSGTKMGLFLRMMCLAWGVRVMSGRIPWKIITVSGLLLVPFLMFTTLYRNEVRSSNRTVVTASGAAALLIPTAGKVVTESNFVTARETAASFVMRRFRGIDGVAIVVQKSPNEIAYIPLNQSIGIIPASLVPRIIWSGKPVYVEGLAFARQYFGQDSQSFNSLTPTVIGDLYRRGGVVSVLLGMFTLGLLGRKVSLIALIGQYPRRFVLLAPVAVELLNLEGGVVLLPASLLQIAIGMFVGIRLATTESR